MQWSRMQNMVCNLPLVCACNVLHRITYTLHPTPAIRHAYFPFHSILYLDETTLKTQFRILHWWLVHRFSRVSFILSCKAYNTWHGILWGNSWSSKIIQVEKYGLAWRSQPIQYPFWDHIVWWCNASLQYRHDDTCDKTLNAFSANLFSPAITSSESMPKYVCVCSAG